MFLKWVLIGSHNLDRDRTTQMEVVEVAAKIVSQSVKSNRQIQYHCKTWILFFTEDWKLH